MHEVDIEKRTNEMIAALRITENAINTALKQSGVLYRDAAEKKAKLAECNVLLSRFQTLKEQYAADAQRLSFIAEGENAVKDISHEKTCPFCNGKIEPQNMGMHTESLRAELMRIKSEYDGLAATIKDVTTERKTIQQELKTLESKRNELEKHVASELRPLETEQKRTIAELRQYVQMTEELTLIENYTKQWAEKLEQLNKQKDGENEEYHPKDYFEDIFRVEMTGLAKDILQECKYYDFTDARFDLDTFDIVVNGQPKAELGKGYRSFLNTVVLLMFRRYLYEHAIYDPRMFIIDTPLHGFDEGVDCQMPDSMRKGLFNYFINHQEEGQLIVIENLDHIPELPYEANGATVTTFNKGRNGGLGRYGFLNGVN